MTERERDPEKEAKYDREAAQIGELFSKLHLDRIARSENVDAALVCEIEATGLRLRDAILAASDSFDRAMDAIEKAARAWEEAAPL